MQTTNSAYTFQGIALTDLTTEYGTPLYVYNSEKILSQYKRLHDAFAGVNVRIKYAAKALTNQAILKLLKCAGAGVDVVSIQELELAMKAGFLASDIMFTPNCVDFSEIEAAVNYGVQINIDNIPFLIEFGKKYGSSVPCCVRINPHID